MIITSHRFEQLKAGAPITTSEEEKSFKELLRWEKRSQAAKRAVQTKRQKFAKWPCRRNN
jgi:hypothetical protein